MYCFCGQYRGLGIVIYRAFCCCRRKVLVTHENSNIEITGELLQCLAPRAWLNDEVIVLALVSLM